MAMVKERDIIGKISDIRVSNNRLWMRLLEIALERAPKKTRRVLAAIRANDQRISDLTGKLSK